ncbi:Polysaccharide biosynthesis protein [Rubripirellula lacrimiformis]|uniref:Polysaccharide biosynthesis protein n=1 Tax=Rubripirellula lacrimiformis TaxID=1930273 RepID=A0A517N5Y9_9BACT|nr:lipopolysaccharide biosynthesis protein [Rubripirellula lacrimiformis]QDT02543.1 Polysaccharide biosynthesis protein [Rubripirellula lacrimiformis]
MTPPAISPETLAAENLQPEREESTATPAADGGYFTPRSSGESDTPGQGYRRHASQFVSTTGIAFAIVGLQLGQGILLARLLGPEGRGEYAAAMLYVQLLLYVGLFGGIEAVCRRATEAVSNSAEGRYRLRRAALWLGITTGTITMLIAIALNLLALPGDKRYLIPVATLCSLSILGQHAMLIMTAVDRGAGEFGRYNVRRLIAAAAFPCLLLIAAMVTTIDVHLAAWMFVASSGISMVACLIGLPQPFRGPSRPTVRTLAKESRPYGVSMLATDLFERLDLLLVLWLAPMIEQGFYAAMVPAVYPLTVIPNTLGMFLFNAGANSDKRLGTSDIHRILGSSVAVQVASTIAFMLLIGPLVRLFYGDAFEPAIIFALWLAPVSAIKGILQGLDSYLKGRGRPLAPIRARFLAIGVMFAATWGLFDTYGTLSIAIAALAGQLVCFVWLTSIVYSDVHQSD